MYGETYKYFVAREYLVTIKKYQLLVLTWITNSRRSPMKYQIFLLLMLGLYKGFTASHINECLNSPCHQNATCENTIGLYICTCPCGYLGNGVNCTKGLSPLYLNNKQVLIQSKCAIVKDNLVTTLPYVGKEYYVKFEVFPTIFKIGWSNVIHFSTHGNVNQYGDIIPAVYFHSSYPTATSNMLRMCSAVNGNKNHCYNSKGPGFRRNRWSTVEISQTKDNKAYKYTIKLNGILVYIITNNDARQFSNVKVYAGDPFNDPQPGFIRNLAVASDINQCLNSCHQNATCENVIGSYICTCPCGYLGNGVNCTRGLSPLYINNKQVLIQSKCAIVKDSLVATLPYVGKEYYVKFELFPTIFKGGWSNVIHFSTHGNVNQYGDRIPAVYFHSSYPTARSNMLRMCSAVNGNKNHCYTSKGPGFRRNRWSTVEIAQTNVKKAYKYTIKLNGVLVYIITNNDARQFSNVKVYAGDPFYDPQPGFIRNLTVEYGLPSNRCESNKSCNDHGIIHSKEYSKNNCSLRCCENIHCIGFSWDVNSKDCWLSDTAWSLASLNNYEDRWTCKLKDYCLPSKYTCKWNKIHHGYGIAYSTEKFKHKCAMKCCRNKQCLGFDWDVNSKGCWLMKTLWSKAALKYYQGRWACQLKDIKGNGRVISVLTNSGKSQDTASYLAAAIAGIVIFVAFLFMLRVYFRNKYRNRRVRRRTSTAIPMENIQTTEQVTAIEQPTVADNVDDTVPSNPQASNRSGALESLNSPPAYESFYPSASGNSHTENIYEVPDDLRPPPSYCSVYPVDYVPPSERNAFSNPAFTTDLNNS